MWDDLRADNAGLRPTQTPEAYRVTFSQWYDNWLEDALRQATSGEYA